jgi:hypothetical protein
MVFVGGDPESNRKKNAKLGAIKEQAKAHIRDFYDSLTAAEKSDLRDFLRSYLKLQKNKKYVMRFGALQQRLSKGVMTQKANADVLASTKSFTTVDQILAVVNAMEPLVERPFRKRL